MSESGRDYFQIDPRYQPLMRQIGLDATAVFEHPYIKVWRSIPERENCTLDAELDGREIRLHIKRYRAVRSSKNAAEVEVSGIELLNANQIPTVPLVGWGKLADGRSFVISEDLKDFRAADKAIASGLPFDRLIEATADLAAKLHASGLHHRDLYLCHFFVKAGGDDLEMRLIDAARVRQLPWLFRQRWIVKDLAQLWYSARQLGIVEDQLIRWLGRYTDQAGKLAPPLGAIEAKVGWIKQHDRKLNQSQPNRNVSIPGTSR
jgi:heptose I phosphotransferase